MKNKIPLPVNECRYLFGCALESTLNEGQCFIRYQILQENGRPLNPPKFDCVRGRVIVTKNPWLSFDFRWIENRIETNFENFSFLSPYAGDMLELWAVDLPELYHLKDVIVFSTSGERKIR